MTAFWITIIYHTSISKVSVAPPGIFGGLPVAPYA